MEITRVGIVGAGLMGAGIAEVCARAGRDVAAVEVEVDDEAVELGLRRVEQSLGRAVAKEKLDEAGRAAALERLRFSTEIGDLADRQLVIEAVVEHEPVKLEVFRTLDEVVGDPNAILA
ncbi:MAG: 3-hydroxyacyl-CoA dehydrogenase NAD-binding domain-containing protein, partial [Acidimicrobiia bacterium]